MKDFGTWQDLSFEDNKKIRDIEGLTLGSCVHRVTYTKVRRLGDTLLLLTRDTNQQGIYDCWEGEWGTEVYLSLLSVDLTSGRDLGQFVLKYVDKWPRGMNLQRMYDESINEKQIYLEDNKIHIEIIKKWWGETDVRIISYGGETYSWKRSKEPSKTETLGLKCEISPK